MSKLNILIAGSTGYIGVQLIKMLVKHNGVKIKYLCGNTSIGKKISFFEKSLNSKNLPKIVKFKKEYLKDVDLIFTALPNGQAQEISNNLLMTIKDEGPGFSETSTQKIFKRFYSNRPKNFGKHSGLGLNIVKNIIELHKGTIAASNRINTNGAKVEVLLPKYT